MFALLPVTALLLLVELTIRLIRDPLYFGSFRELRTDLLKRNFPAILDSTLGYVPEPDFENGATRWGTLVSIDADGIRKNGPDTPPLDGPIVVAVGDSFTFGDQVDDGDSWPARLERELLQPVKNGGVFGYSLTQTVLRGEALLQKFQPAALIVSFIPDDLRRSIYSRRYTTVPWFDLVDGALVLQGVPIDHAAQASDSSKRWKDALGYSALLDGVFASASPAWWFENEKQVVVEHLWAHTAEIGSLLVDRIAAACRARDVRLLLLLQSDAPTPEALEVLRHAESIGVHTLDLATRFMALAEEDADLHRRWFRGHMTAAGNQWVATQVAEVLRSWR